MIKPRGTPETIVQLTLVRRVQEIQKDRPELCILRYPRPGASVLDETNPKAYLILKGEIIESLRVRTDTSDMNGIDRNGLSMKTRSFGPGMIVFPQALDERFRKESIALKYHAGAGMTIVELTRELADLLGITREAISVLAETEHQTAVALDEMSLVFEADFQSANADRIAQITYAQELEQRLEEARRENARLRQSFMEMDMRLQLLPAVEPSEEFLTDLIKEPGDLLDAVEPQEQTKKGISSFPGPNEAPVASEATEEHLDPKPAEKPRMTLPIPDFDRETGHSQTLLGIPASKIWKNGHGASPQSVTVRKGWQTDNPPKK